VAVPSRKLLALIWGLDQGEVPLISPPGAYHEVAERSRRALARAGLSLESVRPPWHARVLSGLLRGLGGAALGDAVPDRLEVLAGGGLELTLYPAGATIRGRRADVARAQSILAEEAPRTPALQTIDPKTQKVEQEIRRMWARRAAHRGARGALERREMTELFGAIAALDADYEDWETVYRQALELALATRGGSRLLERAIRRTAPADESVPSRRRRVGAFAEGKLIASAPGRIATLAERLAGQLMSGKRLGR